MNGLNNLVETFKEGWLDEDPRVVFAVLSGIAVFIFLNILHSRYQKNLQKLKQKAIDDNTVIIARIKSRYRDLVDARSEYNYTGRYRYVVNGEEKKYSVKSSNPLPDTLELYPKNKKGTRVFSDFDYNKGFGFGFTFNALVGIAVLIFILFITGYIGS